MFLHRVQSTYGRLVPKPEKDNKAEEIIDEIIPIQDQIEALRTKILLKERYNRVLKEEVEESRLGASTILQDLRSETSDLQSQLYDAMNSERAAVQNALRTQRDFQLAMTDKTPLFAIAWLDDKLFDLSKHLNVCLNRLVARHGALEAAEIMVLQIEKWPRAGTLPWEVNAITHFHHIESLTENMKVNLETANILHTNYHEIKYLLREEKGKYAPILRNLGEQVISLKLEKRILQKMLDESYYFRIEAEKNLLLTEKEASENRKKRRRQMTKMKKAVQKVLEANQSRPPVPIRKGFFDIKIELAESKAEFLEGLRLKRSEVEKYQARARRLVEIMRVQDLTFIPTRFRSVMELGERLLIEQNSKEQLRNLLLRHNDQLYLIMSHFSYTGLKRETDYKARVVEYNLAFKEVELRKEVIVGQLNRYGDIIVRLRLIAIALLDHLDEGRRRHHIRPELAETLKIISPRVKRLLVSVKALQDLFGNKKPQRNYSQFVKPTQIPSRLIRVGTPAQSEESDEDEFIDMKIPTRTDIKNKSLRVIHQGLQKRGGH